MVKWTSFSPFNMNGFTYIGAKIEIESIKAVPREGMTLDELVEKMKEIGNEVVEINREGNYLLIKK